MPTLQRTYTYDYTVFATTPISTTHPSFPRSPAPPPPLPPPRGILIRPASQEPTQIAAQTRILPASTPSLPDAPRPRVDSKPSPLSMPPRRIPAPSTAIQFPRSCPASIPSPRTRTRVDSTPASPRRIPPPYHLLILPPSAPPSPRSAGNARVQPRLRAARSEPALRRRARSSPPEEGRVMFETHPFGERDCGDGSVELRGEGEGQAGKRERKWKWWVRVREGMISWKRRQGEE